jgi:hypothetical protein
MAKKGNGSLIGAVGSILIGAAMLLFVSTIILNSLMDANADNNSSDDLNDTVDQLANFLEITTILLGVLGLTMIGAAIIGYIGGAFGG